MSDDVRPVTLDPEAAEKVAQFMQTSDADRETCLRLGVRGGGCSGYQYQLALDYQKDDDELFESEGQRVVVNRQMLPLLAGSRILWKDTFTSAGFDVENPNATAACGCGSSFRVDENASGCSEPEGPPTSEDEVYL